MQKFIISGFSDEISENITEQFGVLNKLGIEYFEPRGINGKNISELNDEEVLELKNEMVKYGIKASSVGSPIGKIKLTDDFDEHFEVFRRVVKTAKMLDTKYIRMFSFYHDGGSEWTEDERTAVFERLSQMIEYAKKEDVVLLHENEKDIYGDTISRCVDLMENLCCDNFKSVFDMANFVQCEQNTKEAYDALSEYVEYIHIKDAEWESKKVVPVGKGDGNAEYILKDLKEKGYERFLSLEPHMGSFVGLADLETGDIMSDLPEGGEGTFTVAYNALKILLERI